MPMDFRRPRIQLQLREPITGRYDCTAYEAAVAGDAHSRGAQVFTGRTIRLNTDEPVPDPRSPGLNLRQTDEALFKVSRGTIDLDTRWNEPWPNIEVAGRAGKWIQLAVWREVLNDHGFSGGNTFSKGHSTVWTFDQDMRLWILNDPLVPFWQAVPFSVMREAGAELMRQAAGIASSGGYVSLTRDVFDVAAPVRHSIEFRRGISFFTYDVSPINGILKITDRNDPVRLRGTGTSTAPSQPIRQINWPAEHQNRRLARITAGFMKGLYVEPGAIGVREVIS